MIIKYMEGTINEVLKAFDLELVGKLPYNSATKNLLQGIRGQYPAAKHVI